jgi:hypothetical protein
MRRPCHLPQTRGTALRGEGEQRRHELGHGSRTESPLSDSCLRVFDLVSREQPGGPDQP